MPAKTPVIAIVGASPAVDGKRWESTGKLRLGRLSSLEIPLESSSVSRKHAAIVYSKRAGWVIRDLNSTNGTILNGKKFRGAARRLKKGDELRFGKIVLRIETADVVPEVVDQMRVEVSSGSSWDQAVLGVIYDRQNHLRPGQQLQALVRAGRHLGQIDDERKLLDTILADAVAVLNAQRGAIALLEGTTLKPIPRSPEDSSGHEPSFSKKLARRCLKHGESILCSRVSDDAELACARSVTDGEMGSILCVLLRTPRRVIGVMHLDRSPHQKPFTAADLHLAEALAATVSSGIECARLIRKQRDTIHVLAQSIELKDEYTGGHIQRVTELALRLGRKLGLSAEQLETLATGTPLHDIGKIGIPDDILLKHSPLTPAEFEVMKTHTTKGAKIVAKIPDLEAVVPIVRSHHERWDGTGYPDGLAGEDIPLLARIVTVADAFDAMTSNRVYHPDQKGRSAEEAMDELRRLAGRQFDPMCVQAFAAILDSLDEVLGDSAIPVRPVGA